MESDPHRWIATLRGSHDRLAKIVADLTPDQLTASAYPSEWSVAQVLSHLGSGAEIGQLQLDAGLQRRAVDHDLMPPIWDEWNGRTPQEQGAAVIPADQAYVRRFEALTDAEIDHFLLTLIPGMDFDVAGVARLRLAEHAVHAWDVAVTLDPAATIHPDEADLLVDAVAWTIQFAGKPQGKTFRLRVRTTEPERDLVLDVGESVSLKPATPEDKTDGGLQLPADALIRLIYGRLDPEHTPPLELTAESVTLDDLRAVFPGL